jgi:hypothetical protein
VRNIEAIQDEHPRSERLFSSNDIQKWRLDLSCHNGLVWVRSYHVNHFSSAIKFHLLLNWHPKGWYSWAKDCEGFAAILAIDFHCRPFYKNWQVSLDPRYKGLYLPICDINSNILLGECSAHYTTYPIVPAFNITYII